MGSPGPIIRQNYHAESEAGLNRLINTYLRASYTYISMSGHFDRDDVALPGISKCVGKISDERRDIAKKLMEYQNIRGGRIVLADIKKPDRDEWGNGLDLAIAFLEYEKEVNQALLDLIAAANKQNDFQLADFLETYLLENGVVHLKMIGDAITQLKRVGPGLGEFQVDQKFLHDPDYPDNYPDHPILKAFAKGN